jgi:hypothetical protein
VIAEDTPSVAALEYCAGSADYVSLAAVGDRLFGTAIGLSTAVLSPLFEWDLSSAALAPRATVPLGLDAQARLKTADDGKSVAAIAGAMDGSINLRIFDPAVSTETPVSALRIGPDPAGPLSDLAWSEGRLIVANGGVMKLLRLADGVVTSSLTLNPPTAIVHVWMVGGRAWAELPDPAATSAAVVLVQLQFPNDTLVEVGRVSLPRGLRWLYDNGDDNVAATTRDGVTIIGPGCGH